MNRTVIIAAMEREIRPLVRGWHVSSISDRVRSFAAFEKDERVVVISGIGRKHAEAAARVAIAQYRPAQLISAGLAGALIRSLKAGSVVTPNVVVDAADGAEYRCTLENGGVVGGGVLVSAAEIADAMAKPKLVEQFHGLVVDMEAASVARAAQDAGVGFRCVKAISDEADFVMPPLAQFVDREGNFQSRRFAAWTAVRPWQWARVIKLGRNTSKAVRALCDWLEKNLTPDRVAAEVVTLKRNRVIGKPENLTADERG
jgi:adenosylhomocysteine nucleosidase